MAVDNKLALKQLGILERMIKTMGLCETDQEIINNLTENLKFSIEWMQIRKMTYIISQREIKHVYTDTLAENKMTFDTIEQAERYQANTIKPNYS